MNQPTESASLPSEPVSADDLLPPVQPPAATFIMQLFLIPLLIVSIIVAVWLMFSWLARSGNDPQELVADIERLNHASWQKALTLAQHLRDDRQSDLRKDEAFAQRLADLLEKQIKEGRVDKDHLSLRMYLCRVLGEFEVANGLPALAVAATTENRQEDAEVRRAALQAIAILSGRLEDDELARHKEVLAAVIKGTDEYAEDGEEKLRRQLLRSTATYALGTLPGDEAMTKLAALLHDPSSDVRYNAAIGLARHGDSRAIPTLIEMLDPPEQALLDPDFELEALARSGQRDWKRSHIVGNGLRSMGKFSQDYPAANLAELTAAVEQVAADTSRDGAERLLAAEVLRMMKRGSPSAPSAQSSAAD